MAEASRVAGYTGPGFASGRMFTNKHIITALIVTPILAVIGWFAVDYAVSERPHAARGDASYELVAGSDCRYGSGQCTLRNGQFRVTVRASQPGAAEQALEVESRFPVDAVRVALATPGDSPAPRDMIAAAEGGQSWSLPLRSPGDDARLLLVLIDGTTRYYAEVGTVFFQQDNAGQ